MKVIQYEAVKASRRVLTSEDFASNGVENQPGAVWDNFNAWRVPVNHFSPEALEVVLRQPGLTEVEINGTEV